MTRPGPHDFSCPTNCSYCEHLIDLAEQAREMNFPYRVRSGNEREPA